MRPAEQPRQLLSPRLEHALGGTAQPNRQRQQAGSLYGPGVRPPSEFQREALYNFMGWQYTTPEEYRPETRVVPYGGPDVSGPKGQKRTITEFGGRALPGWGSEAQYAIDRLQSLALDIPSGTREFQRLRASELIASGNRPPRITPYVQHALGITDEWLTANNYIPGANFTWYRMTTEDEGTYWSGGGGAGGGYGGYAVGGGPKGPEFTGLVHWRI